MYPSHRFLKTRKYHSESFKGMKINENIFECKALCTKTCKQSLYVLLPRVKFVLCVQCCYETYTNLFLNSSIGDIFISFFLSPAKDKHECSVARDSEKAKPKIYFSYVQAGPCYYACCGRTGWAGALRIAIVQLNTSKNKISTTLFSGMFVLRARTLPSLYDINKKT